LARVRVTGYDGGAGFAVDQLVLPGVAPAVRGDHAAPTSDSARGRGRERDGFDGGRNRVQGPPRAHVTTCLAYGNIVERRSAGSIDHYAGPHNVCSDALQGHGAAVSPPRHRRRPHNHPHVGAAGGNGAGPGSAAGPTDPAALCTHGPRAGPASQYSTARRRGDTLRQLD